MSVNTFWIILVKVLGLILLYEFFNVVAHFVSLIVTMFNGSDYMLFSLAFSIPGFVIYFLLMYSALFKTEWVVSKLKLDLGLENEELKLDAKQINIVTLTVIILGSLIMINSVPEFFKQLFNFFQMKEIFRENPESGALIYSVVKSIIGFFLVTRGRTFAHFIVKRSKVHIDESDEIDVF